MAVTTEVLDSLAAVEPLVPEWDRLAVDCDLPYCAPAWLLAWWRHASPPGAKLRLVVVRDGDRLLGIGPFFATRWRARAWTWQLIGADTTSRIQPLARAEDREAVAHELTQAIAGGSPRADRIWLEGVPSGSQWVDLISRAWPGRPPWRHVGAAIPAPVVPLAGGNVDDWLGSRSSNFRQQMRRSRRKLEKAGAVFRVAATPDEIERDLAEFRRLHEARWESRGGSSAFPPGTDQLLRDAGRELVDSGRYQLISLELDGRVINSQLFVAAGGEVSYWNGGFDDEFGSYKPSLVGLVEAIRLSIAGGLTRFDLGPGAQEYKSRFADDHDELLWQTLIPRGHRRYAFARLLYAPRQVRRAVAVRLTPEQKARIRGMLRRGDGAG